MLLKMFSKLRQPLSIVLGPETGQTSTCSIHTSAWIQIDVIVVHVDE